MWNMRSVEFRKINVLSGLIHLDVIYLKLRQVRGWSRELDSKQRPTTYQAGDLTTVLEGISYAFLLF